MERPVQPRDPAGSEQVNTTQPQEKCGKKPPEGEVRSNLLPKLQEERRMRVSFRTPVVLVAGADVAEGDGMAPEAG